MTVVEVAAAAGESAPMWDVVAIFAVVGAVMVAITWIERRGK